MRQRPPPPAWIGALREGLQDLGLVEGKNVAIEFGLASSEARVPEAAAELVRLKVDVIVASGTPSALAAKEAASAIPVVFVAAIDPVATGLVTSLARPGGNVTGLPGYNCAQVMHADLGLEAQWAPEPAANVLARMG